MRAEHEQEIIREVVARFENSNTITAEWREHAKNDLRFVNGDTYNHGQWSDAEYNQRQGTYSGNAPRVTLTVNKTRQHVLQVENSARQQQQGIKINATGTGAHAVAANALEGIIRHIETRCNAPQNAYMTAIQGQVRQGIGWVHLETDYTDDDSFTQDLYIRSVPNPLSVHWDPNTTEGDHSDMQWAMIVEDVDRAEFERRYNEDADEFSESVLPFGDAGSQNTWTTRHTIRVAIYYRRSERRDWLWSIPNIQQDGSVIHTTLRQSDMNDDEIAQARELRLQRRRITPNVVERFVVAGGKVIANGDTVFSCVPLVPFICEEYRGDLIGGQRDYVSFVRPLIDPQRMYNYAASAFVESVALQTKAPFIAPSKAIAGYEQQWAMANTANLSVLPYNDTDNDGNTIAAPQRMDPPSGSTGHAQILQSADEQMQMVSGQYQSEMGAPGNERTGVAIQQRQRQSDTATYHCTDNQGRALRYLGRLMLEAIPKLYDDARAVLVLDIDGSNTQAVIDPNAQQSAQVALPPGVQPQQGASMEDQLKMQGAILAINPMIGKYAVEADVGPAFATQRQDAFNALTQMVQADPALMSTIGDLIFRTADFPYADVIADRLKPASDDPKLAAAQQQLQAAQSQIAALTQQLKNKQGDQQIAMARLQHDQIVDAMAEDTDRFKALTDRIASIGSEDPAAVQPLLMQAIREALASTLTPPAPTPPANDAGGTIHRFPRMPTTNPPGGPIRDANPTPGDIQ